MHIFIPAISCLILCRADEALALSAGSTSPIISSSSTVPIHTTTTDDGSSDPLGPPPQLRSLRIDGPPLRAFRRLLVGGDKSPNQHTFTIERASYGPDLFVLRDFVTPDERRRIIDGARESTMGEAETEAGTDPAARRGCRITWMDNARLAGIVGNLAMAAGNILLADEVKSGPGIGCEDLQVLHYEEGGRYIFHHDGNGRILTVLYYLNGCGSTYFPLARVEDDKEAIAEVDRLHNTREEALGLAQGLTPGFNGLLIAGAGSEVEGMGDNQRNTNCVRIEAGDALAFYNYQTLPSGEAVPNWSAIHSGLPTPPGGGGKWIANHWYHGGSAFSEKY